MVGTDIENINQKAILSDVGKKGKDPTQIEKWSILSDYVKYIKPEWSETFHNLNVTTLNYHQNKSMYKELKEKESLKSSVNFGGSPVKLK